MEPPPVTGGKEWGLTLYDQQVDLALRRSSIDSRLLSACLERSTASSKASIFRRPSSQCHLFRYKGLASNIPRRFLYRHLSVRRKIRPLCICCFSLLFVATMRRILTRYRKKVRFETIQKVRAAFMIQCAWRAHQQRERIRQQAAIRVLVPFLRGRLTRIARRKEMVARFLQRVFRSQRERHFVRWMYQNMKYNQAVSLIRSFLKRCVAYRYRMKLSLQREERRACESQYASMALAIIREERKEILRIQRKVNRAAPAALKPLIPRVVLESEILQTTGYSAVPPPPLTSCDSDDGNPLCSAAKREAGTVGSSGKLTKTASDLPWTSALHTGDGARQLLAKLFECWLPHCLMPDGENAGIKGRNGNIPPLDQVQPSDQPQEDDKGANKRTNVLSSVAYGSVRHLMEVFLELLICTESVERRVVEADIQRRRREMFGKVVRARSIIQSMGTAPSLFTNLLVQMGETCLVLQAEKLFREEQDKRHKMLEEYMVIPLQFLDRPMRSAAAEERRKWIRQRVRTLRGFTSECTGEPNNDAPVATRDNATKGSGSPCVSLLCNAHYEMCQDDVANSLIMSVSGQGLLSPRHCRQGMPFITLLPLNARTGAPYIGPQSQNRHPALHSQRLASVVSSCKQLVQARPSEGFMSCGINAEQSTPAASPLEVSMDVMQHSEPIPSGWGGENLLGSMSTGRASNVYSGQCFCDANLRVGCAISTFGGERSQRVEELEVGCNAHTGGNVLSATGHLPVSCQLSEGGRLGDGENRLTRGSEIGASQGPLPRRLYLPLLRASRQVMVEPMRLLHRSEISSSRRTFKSRESGADYVQQRRISS